MKTSIFHKFYNTFFYVFMAPPYVDGSLVVPFPLFRLAFRIAVRHFYHLVTLNIYTTMDDDKTRCCGNCELCVHTYLGSECGLNDNPVDDNQAACIDYIPED